MKRFAPYLSHTTRPSIAAFCVAALCSTAAGEARADASPADKITAKALFDAARVLTKDSKYEEACLKLAESQRLDPSMGTEFYLAECNEHLGKIATAWIYYEEVANLALAAGNKPRETFTRGRADALKARVPKLVIEVPAALQGVAGLVIKRDQEAVSMAQWGLSLPVNPAKYVISAEATGRKGWSVTVDVKEGAAETVMVPVLEAVLKAPVVVPAPVTPVVQPTAQPAVPPTAPPKVLPPAPPPKALPTVPPPAPAPPPPDHGQQTRSNVPSYVLFGLGGVSAVVGIAFAAKGVGALSTFNTNPTSDNADAVDRHALTADVAFAGAALLGVSGLVWWLGNRPSNPKVLVPVATSGPKVFVAPRIGFTGCTVNAGFAF